jgi:hypothetical protein
VADFVGRLELTRSPARAGPELVLSLRVANAGRRYWPLAGAHPLTVGGVSVAPHLARGGGERLELSRVALPEPVPPGGVADVTIRLAAADLAGHEELRVDLVREGIAWFEDLGGAVLRVPVPGAPEAG